MSDKRMGGQKTNTDTPNHIPMSVNISKHANRDAAHIHLPDTIAYFVWETCIN